ncbi:MAG: metallophosphoesterase family protein [Chloroflexota bacterium]
MSPELTFIQISDTHIGPRGQLQYETDTGANLVAVADRVREMALEPVAFIFSGDLSNHGEAESYQHFQDLLAEHFEPFGVPLLLGLGNHDLRVPFRQIILGQSGWSDEAVPYYYSQVIHGVRFIMLDSVLPGMVYGHLGPEQLAWLDAELTAGGPEGNVVVIHHPSLPRGVPRPDDYLLNDRAELARVLARHSVLAVLCGHSHVFTSGIFGGTLHVAATATAYLLDPSIRDGGRGLEGAGFNICTLRDGQLIVNPVTLPGAQRELYRHFLTFSAMPDREVATHV